MVESKHSGKIAILPGLLARVPHLLYAQVIPGDGGASQVSIAFNDEPKRVVQTFDDEASRLEFWAGLQTVMTRMCSPPCVLIGSTSLFQSAYLHRVVCYEADGIHFVILDFQNDQNLWLGSRDAQTQIALYRGIHHALGVPFRGLGKPDLVKS